MAVMVQRVTLWRQEVANRPGALAEVLEPLSATGADLHVVMGYRERGKAEAVVEVYPVVGRKLSEAAEGVGLHPSSIPTVLVRGDNRPALGHRVARALADGGLNVAFLVAQVVGRKYSAVFGFESASDADRAVKLIRKAAGARR
jgi:hypothetical protein